MISEQDHSSKKHLSHVKIKFSVKNCKLINMIAEFYHNLTRFSEEKIESLFGCINQNRNERRKDSPSLEPAVQYIQIINPKKAQNLSILLRALNVSTEEVIDALKEGEFVCVSFSLGD